MATVGLTRRFVTSSYVLLPFIAFLLYVFHVWENSASFALTKQLSHKANVKSASKSLQLSFLKVFGGNGDNSEEDPVENVPFDEDNISVIITLSKARQYRELQEKFNVCVSSMLSKTTTPIVFYILGDDDSKDIAEGILHRASGKRQVRFSILSYKTYV